VPTYQTMAIVVGRTNFGEADRILRMITPDHGKISAIAKGVRKVKSRSGGHLELFGEVDLMLATGRSLDVVTSARLQWYPHNLSQTYSRLSLAFTFATMTDRLLEEQQPQPEVYKLLAAALHALDGPANEQTLELWFKLRLLNLLGYRPELDRCVSCGVRDAGRSYSFSAERGGIMDDGCRDATARPMSHDTIKFWRLLSDHPYAVAGSISGAQEIAVTSLPDCDNFCEYHLGKAFKVSQLSF
jgi:DNA repair protein RecO (recombination protein O)